MRTSVIVEENRHMLGRQREFRIAADVVTEAWATFQEVVAIAVIGSVAKPLWKEVPRFREFRRADIEIWHECGDLDLALWLETQDRLQALRRAASHALRDAFESGAGISVANHQVDVFLFEPGSDRQLGRLCKFSQCPRGRSNAWCLNGALCHSIRSWKASGLMRTCWLQPHIRCSIGAARGDFAPRSIYLVH